MNEVIENAIRSLEQRSESAKKQVDALIRMPFEDLKLEYISVLSPTWYHMEVEVENFAETHQKLLEWEMVVKEVRKPDYDKPSFRLTYRGKMNGSLLEISLDVIANRWVERILKEAGVEW